MATPGRIAKFDAAGHPADSSITETNVFFVGVGTTTPQVKTQFEGTNDQQATIAIRRADNGKFMRLGVGTLGVALDFDPGSFFVIQRNAGGIGAPLNGQELLRVTSDGRVGIKTPQPATPLHVSGNVTLDTGDSPVLFTGTGAAELNRYLNLINSTGLTSASGLKAGGVLVSDDYSFANPGKNDVVVKGSVGIQVAHPVSALHVRGYVTLDADADALVYTGTANAEQNRYLQLLNSPTFRSASGLRAGGVLISDDYSFANPGKNDLVVKGSATIGGDVFLTGGDCAEDFDVSTSEDVEPGTVMVMNQEGILEPCRQAYDKRVTGVISGAGDLRPGIVLDKRRTQHNRMPVALLGKVYCKVDAGYGSVELGDLLVTSPTPAHAMRAGDPARAFGAVIGKALRGLESGRGLVPILVSLQ
jgi:hypothetical protein